jgi:hypothetical protein
MLEWQASHFGVGFTVQIKEELLTTPKIAME